MNERIFYDPPTAIIPEEIGLGVFATEVVIFYGENEVTIDFIQGIVKPFRLVSRIILNFEVAKKLFQDLKKEIISIEERKEFKNLVENLLENSKSENEEKIKVDSIYDELKLSTEQLKGFYANKILITYGKDAFCIDFVNNTFPKSIVVSRVFMSFNRSFELINVLKKIIQQ
jgi:hypothetical protein